MPKPTQDHPKMKEGIFFQLGLTSSSLEDGEIVRGKHELLISEEIFLAVNGLVNKNPHGWKRMNQNDEMPLKGLVKCDKCDRPLTAYPQKGKYFYYKCPNDGCRVNISNTKLHKLFSDELSKFTVQSQLLPLIKKQLEATYIMLHAAETTREKPMKDELTRLKNELEIMELNLATSKISPELFQKVSAGHHQKIRNIKAELETFSRDSSNFDKHMDAVLKNTGNLLKMWQLLDCDGKSRLQKLLYPDGIHYLKENHAVRTISINPIFSAISSISQILTSQSYSGQGQNNEVLPQLYLRFPSSNFFWENLEKMANLFDDLIRSLNGSAIKVGEKSQIKIRFDKKTSKQKI